MSFTDPIGDMLARLRNSQMRGHLKTVVRASRLVGWVLDVLVEEGYIKSYVRTEKIKHKSEFYVSLSYYDGRPVIRKMLRVSKPGRRVYARAKAIPKYYGGLGVSVLSTSQGIMSGARALHEGLGGEVLCFVF